MIAGDLIIAPLSTRTPVPKSISFPSRTAPPMITVAPTRISPLSLTIRPPLVVSP